VLKFGIGGFAALAMVFLATSAEARGSGFGGGSAEFLEYVADFGVPPEETGGKQLYVCHLIKKYTVIGIPLFYLSEGYVLAENHCDTESYMSFNPGGFVDAQAEGLIAAKTPAEPSISLERRMPTVLLGLVLAFGIFKGIRRKRNQSKRMAEMGGIPLSAQRLLDVLCHAAKSDGAIGEDEIGLIAGIAAMVTGVKFDPATIRRMIELSEKSLQPNQFAKFGEGMNERQKESLMQAVFMVVAADGQVAKAESAFIIGLARGLSLSQARFDQIVAEIRAPATA
jgi:tellurite resistance protein